jgi:hypothetical protein
LARFDTLTVQKVGPAAPPLRSDQVEVIKDLSAGAPWFVGQVPAVELEDIEDEERDRMGFGVVAATMDAGAQQLEVGRAIRGEHDHLAVEHHITHRRETLEFGKPVHPLAP